MKSVLLAALLIVTPAFATHAAILNNSTTSLNSEDSLSVAFCALDSIGNNSTADSLLLFCTGPDGAVVYKDSMTVNDSRISVDTVRGRVLYTFADQVSNLDGSGAVGSYTIVLVALDNALGLETAHLCPFQIVSSGLSEVLATIDDSVLVKGGAVDSNRTERGSMLDSAAVAAYVWNSPQSNHTLSGSFGNYLDAPVSGISSGAGAYAYTLLAFDSIAAQPVPGVSMAVRSLDQATLFATAATDPSGVVSFNLDAAGYRVVATAPGYIFDSSDSITVSGADVDTVFGHQFDPGNPVQPLFCRVYGFLYLADGTAEQNATVTAGIPDGVVRFDNLLISPFETSTVTDSIGYFYLDLIPSDSLVPPGTPYEISIYRDNGTILRRKITIPATTTWRLEWQP